MKPEAIRNAIREARRFIATAQQVKLCKSQTWEYIETGKASGACRRASLDLTRALAEMRKP